MRSLIAAALFVVSLITGGVGLGLQTIWAPPSSYVEKLELEGDVAFATISNQSLQLHPGKPTVKVTGDARVYIGYGREADVFAWLGSSSHLLIRPAKTGNSAFEVRPAYGTSLNAANPAGSDLWRDEVGGKITAELAIDPSDDAVVLLAANGTLPVPSKIEISWKNRVDLYWSNFLLVSGLVIFSLATLLLVIDRRLKRIANGPKRRYRKPPKPPKVKVKRKPPTAPIRGRRAMRRRWLAIAVFAPLVLSGCTSAVPGLSGSADPSASATLIDVKPPAVTPAQLAKILVKVSDAVRIADAEKDKKLLAKRVDGAALTMRSAHYVLQSKSEDIAALPEIAATPISFSLPMATDSWPRSVFAITTSKLENGIPQLLVLTQNTPRAQYKLTYYVNLIPGVDIPEVASSEVGAIAVDPKSLFLKLPPLDLVTAYGDVLNKGKASLSAGLFELDDDAFYKQISASQKQQVASLPNATFKFEHALLERKKVTALSTSNSGALVVLYMQDTYTIKPRNGNSAVAVSGDEKLLLGADGSTRGVRTKYGNMMFFYVPSLSSDAGIKLLGATQGLLSVKSL